MSRHEDEPRAASQRCPQCHQQFQTLADEAGQHACPACGYAGERTPEDAREVCTTCEFYDGDHYCGLIERKLYIKGFITVPDEVWCGRWERKA